jgi:hypothetical protein
MSATAFGGAGRQGSIAEPTLGQGRPPGPARGGVAPIFQGTFTHSGWRGSAPGICEDKDCGHLVAGRDGATGPTFDIFLPARISANGSFAHSESRKAKRSPYRPASSATIKGTFDGDTVQGTLRASKTTQFDSCTANMAFKARRIQ